MAKPHHDEAGSSCHIHLNLTLADTGKNAFAGDKDLVNGIKCSDTFRHFLGGWIKYTPGTDLNQPRSFILMQFYRNHAFPCTYDQQLQEVPGSVMGTYNSCLVCP